MLVPTRLGLPFSKTTSEPSASISPVVAATPGTVWIRFSTELENGSWKPPSFLLTVRNSTTTSFLTLTASKIWENARSICPVTTKVPEIIATPSTIENAVRRARSGRARRLASVSPSIAAYSSDLI